MDTAWNRRQDLSLHPATATAAETDDWHGRSMQSDKGSSAQVRNVEVQRPVAAALTARIHCPSGGLSLH